VSSLTAVTWVTAFLLVVAGARKIARPRPTAVALGAVGLPSSPALVRMFGVVEMALGTAVVVAGGVVACGLVGALHLGFSAIAARQRRAGADCGCFGTTGTPVTARHVWLDAALAAVALGAAAAPAPPLADLVLHDPLVGVVTVASAATAASLLRLLLTSAVDLRSVVGLVTPDGTA